MSRDVLATACFGLVPLGAHVLVLLTTECRVHLVLDARACARIVGKSILFTIPVAAAIMVFQSWQAADGAKICLGRGTFVAGAFVLSALLAFVTVCGEQVETASGVKLSERYRGRFMLFLLALAMVFYVVRVSLGLSPH